MHSKRVRVHTRGCLCVCVCLSFVYTHAHRLYVCATGGGSVKRATSDRNLDGNCPGKVINRVRERDRDKEIEGDRGRGRGEGREEPRLLKRFGSHCSDWSSISSDRKGSSNGSLIQSLLRKSEDVIGRFVPLHAGLFLSTALRQIAGDLISRP